MTLWGGEEEDFPPHLCGRTPSTNECNHNQNNLHANDGCSTLPAEMYFKTTISKQLACNLNDKKKYVQKWAKIQNTKTMKRTRKAPSQAQLMELNQNDLHATSMHCWQYARKKARPRAHWDVRPVTSEPSSLKSSKGDKWDKSWWMLTKFDSHKSRLTGPHGPPEQHKIRLGMQCM